jgi:hypothetical protein
MAVQFSVTLRNAMLDAIETTISTTPKLQIYSGSAPATCATAASGTKLAEFTLDSDWASAASSGTKTMIKSASALSTSNYYTTTAVAGAPTNAGYYRIVDSAGTTCHEQGTVTATGGGGDLTLDNISIASGQEVRVTGFVKTAPGA